jgi:signal transduction histidine kinase
MVNTEPQTRRLPTLGGVVLAVAMATLALLLTLPLRNFLANTQVPLFYAAVAVVAYFTGFSGAALAIVLSLGFAEMFLFAQDTPGLTVLVRDGIFVAIASGIALLSDRLRVARDRAERKTAEVEQLVTQLRENATELERRATDAETMARRMEKFSEQTAAQRESAQRAAERAVRLQRLTATLLNQVGGAAVARVIVTEGRRAVEAAGAAIAVPSEHGVEVLATEGYSDQQVAQGAALLRGRTPIGDALQSGEAVYLHNRAELAERYPEVAATMVRANGAWAVLPLHVEQRHIGVVGFTFGEPGEFDSDERAYMELVAQQCAQALERARLHDMELRARVRAEFAERRLSFLADASGRLAASLDYVATLANVAQAAVPEIADWCMVHLLDDDGMPRLVTMVHNDPEQVTARRALEAKYPPSMNATGGFWSVFHTGKSDFRVTISDEDLRNAAIDHEHFEALRRFGLRSQMTVPIVSEERTTGIITLATAESGRIFSNSDLRLAQELARRAGQAVENARLYQAAHHASVAKSDFLAVMSHELRTPLNAIIGYSDLLLLGVPDGVPDRARRQVERIRGASTSLLQLVEEVLSFSRIEAGKEEIRISPVDINAVVRECVNMIEPMAAEKGLALEVNFPEGSLKLVSDERKIRQIVTNLLSNAVKFTEQGGIGVRTEAMEGEVHIEVSDTGIGIDPQHLERIFDPFWQVEQSSTRRFGGTGLGLGVARKLARLLEGRLEVQSHVGRGSTFTLALPMRTPGMIKQQ